LARRNYRRIDGDGRVVTHKNAVSHPTASRIADENGQQMTVTLHRGDLPANLSFGDCVAIDTETMGLKPGRDRLCLVQLSSGDGTAHIVQLAQGDYSAPNLKALLSDPAVTKLFHFGRFDIAVLQQYLGVLCNPVYCTKIASKMTRTFTDRHGLKDLCRDVLGTTISKEQQTSDWGADELTEAQLEYAASDVLHLHELRSALNAMLEREGRMALAVACFEFLPTRAQLDLAGWPETDIFAH
jgi:ribonuclease D